MTNENKCPSGSFSKDEITISKEDQIIESK